ncbi:hypothetical protein MOQ72_39800 [Saccharopolyspora sp. K220]|uniref:hypothetical protein n=1 Tax=Saccharopolyspora soli TaxID=2926618 RepID=UPI001F57D160|nr:hypothetical protein [Saccharopolyspora soli]MCI2423568.1 hypothetical protein [Saccharopolyspora soli]
MTELDALRAALREPPAEDLGDLDVERIMVAGASIRRRRRILISSGVVGLVVAVLFAVFGVGLLRQPGVPPIIAASAPPVGDVISTGIHDAEGELVFYLQLVDMPKKLPFPSASIASGHRAADGRIVQSTVVDYVQLDRPSGLQLYTGKQSSPDEYLPPFGYCVGPATRIIAKLDGRLVQAKQVAWSQDPRVVIFWFDVPGEPSAERFTDIAAYDVAGNRLP